MTNPTAHRPDPGTRRAMAKLAGDRGRSAQPMSLDDRVSAYYRQNGRKALTAAQERRVLKQHGLKLRAQAGGAQ